MSIFQTIKENITLRQAAERYGLSVNNKGMTRCPFHEDDRPSLKLNEDYFYCFGCQAHGDVTNLVARLFGISQYRAAQRLAADFGLDPRPPAQARQPVPAFKQKQEQQRQIQRKELFCISTLDAYLDLLELWKKQYAPTAPEESWDDRYREACQMMDTTLYLRNCITAAPPEQKEQVLTDLMGNNAMESLKAYVDQRKEEAAVEQAEAARCA